MRDWAVLCFTALYCTVMHCNALCRPEIVNVYVVLLTSSVEL